MTAHEVMGMTAAEFARMQKAIRRGAERERRRQKRILAAMLAGYAPAPE